MKTADSAINGSRLVRDDLITVLDALPLWTRDDGYVQDAFWGGWLQEVAVGIEFPMTIIGPRWTGLSMRFSELLEHQGLPNTHLGSSWLEVGERLAEVIRRGVSVSDLFNKKASRLTPDAVHPLNEYDFQNLIATVVRPWVPSLERETVAITFAGQSKHVDFAGCANRL